jgi:hypothetical protein
MTSLLGSMMAAGKKTPEPAAKTEKKKSIPGKIGVKASSSSFSLKAVHSSTILHSLSKYK